MGRILRSLPIIALALALLASPPAWADDVGPLPAGTVIIRPDGSRTELTAVRFLVTRAQVDAANVQARINADLQRRLTEAVRAVEAVRRPEPGWMAGVRWALVGAAFGVGAIL